MRWIIILLVLVIAAGSVVTGSFLYVQHRETREAKAIGETVALFNHRIRRALVYNCERYANPLREAVQKMIQNEIDQSHSPLIHELFPKFDPAALDKLVKEENERRHKSMKEVAPQDCVAVFDKPIRKGAG
jgi:hypothetical protein